METAARRSGGGLMEGLYSVLMRRNSIFITFVIAGAVLGELAVDYGVKQLWEHNNVVRAELKARLKKLTEAA